MLPLFIDIVDDMSAGRIKIQGFGAGEIVGVEEMFDAVSQGVIDGMFTVPAYYEGIEPVFGVENGLAFTLQHISDIDRLFYTFGMNELLREVYGNHNIYFLGPMSQTEMPIFSVPPIRTLDDLKGLKIRTYGFGVPVLEHFGAVIEWVPYSELYVALSSGVVDACTSGTPGEAVDNSIHEAAKYYCPDLPLMGTQEANIVMNMDRWNELPSDLQAILVSATKDMDMWFKVKNMNMDAEALNTMKEWGVETLRLSDADKKLLVEAGYLAWDQAAALDAYSAEAVELTLDYCRFVGYMD